eukprot:TRINITY_DN9027_c0_g1_i1.p1 TRINITY_DN9027_c0_g1~~TRINITY_DN9027_c0_g1_i1.p1  ORF type:complete len:433 (-),score=79.05 TRINITY_DN9027_c0_g1_i1:56-1162(-)
MALRSLLGRVTPAALGFPAEVLPAELRLRMWHEVSVSERLGDSAVELLVETEIKYVRITRAVTDVGLERLGVLCPQLERAYIRTNEMTIKGMLALVSKCKNLKWVDVGWTEIFTSASPEDTQKFFSCLPHLEFIGIRKTATESLDYCLECMKKYCPNLSCINMGRVPINLGTTVPLLSQLESLNALIIDRIPLLDKPFLEMLEVLGGKLLKLEIGDTLVGDKAIAQIPSFCPRLESLGLRNLVALSDFGLVHLLGGEWVEDNQETEPGPERPPRDPSLRLPLKYLDLGGCFELSDLSVSEVAHIPTMEELNLEGLIKITEVSLRKIAAQCKALKKIELPANISSAFKGTHFKGMELRVKQATTVFASY